MVCVCPQFLSHIEHRVCNWGEPFVICYSIVVKVLYPILCVWGWVGGGSGWGRRGEREREGCDQGIYFVFVNMYMCIIMCMLIEYHAYPMAKVKIEQSVQLIFLFLNSCKVMRTGTCMYL